MHFERGSMIRIIFSFDITNQPIKNSKYLSVFIYFGKLPIVKIELEIYLILFSDHFCLLYRTIVNQNGPTINLSSSFII